MLNTHGVENQHQFFKLKIGTDFQNVSCEKDFNFLFSFCL